MNVLMIVYDNNTATSFFPLGLAYLASSIRHSFYEVKIEVWQQDIYHYADYMLTEKLNSSQYDYVLVSMIGGAYQYKKIRSLSDAINCSTRRHSFKYMIGGHGPAGAPEFFLRKTGADVCCVGEGESTIVELLNYYSGKGCVEDIEKIKGIAYLSNGKFIQNQKQDTIKNIDDIPWPAWDLFDINYYASYRFPCMKPHDRAMLMLSGRGCPFKCNFCFRMDKGFRPRSAKSILSEINYLINKYHITYIYFADELLMSSEHRIIDFCNALLEENISIKWWCNGRLNFARLEVLGLMKQSGCVCINYGIESLDDDTREKMGKMLSRKMIIEGVENTIKTGITPGLNFIYGNIDEPLSAIEDACCFLLKYGSLDDFHTIHLVTPFPGSELFEIALERGYIEDEEDFYENKHISYDLLTCNFTDHYDKEIYTAIYNANKRLVEDRYKRAKDAHMKNRYKLLRQRLFEDNIDE